MSSAYSRSAGRARTSWRELREELRVEPALVGEPPRVLGGEATSRTLLALGVARRRTRGSSAARGRAPPARRRRACRRRPARAGPAAPRRARRPRITHGVPGCCRERAKSSGMTPGSPRSSTGAAACASCPRRLRRSATTAERPRLREREAGRGCGASPVRSARFTVASSFCSAIGFSRKSSAPMRSPRPRCRWSRGPTSSPPAW